MPEPSVIHEAITRALQPPTPTGPVGSGEVGPDGVPQGGPPLIPEAESLRNLEDSGRDEEGSETPRGESSEAPSGTCLDTPEGSGHRRGLPHTG